MRELNTYIIEKLKINKDSKIELKTPKNFEELKSLVEGYFWEWTENDPVFKVVNSSKEEMKGVYNHILDGLKEQKYTFKKFIKWVLPLKFRQYMNNTYNLNIDEKL